MPRPAPPFELPAPCRAFSCPWRFPWVFRWFDGRRYEVAALQSRLRVMRISGWGLPLRNGCLTAAIVLGWCFGNQESLLNGATPDQSEPARDADAVSRLQLTQALKRAKYAIAWERSWPHLARLLTVVGLFLVVS